MNSPSRQAWDKHATHPLQSWAWGEFRKNLGTTVVRDVTLTTFHPVPYSPFTIGYCPKSTLPQSSDINRLIQLGHDQRAIFIQLEPHVLRSPESLSHMADLTRRYPIKPSHHPLFTQYSFILDLTKSEDALLAGMSQKTRYNIRLAMKHGVTIQEESSPEAFAEYLKLSNETTKRQKFYAHTPRYHQVMWDTLSPLGMAHLFTARYQGEILAAWIIFVFQNTAYYPYGASSRNHREVMAPNLLLWEIAKWAKRNGCTSFDLWGAMGPEPDITDPWYGFHRFKEGYSPTHVTYIGSYDLIINPFLYPLYQLADTIRWKLLNT